MPHFKTFLKAAGKHLPALSIYFLIFTAMTFLFSATAQDNTEALFQSKSLNLCIIDEDHSAASEALTSYLGSLHNLHNLENDPEVLQDNLYYRFVDYILTIPDGFEAKLTAGESSGLLLNVKIPDSTVGIFADQQVNQYTKTLQLYLTGGYSLEDAIFKTDDILSKAAPIETLSFQKQNMAEKTEVFSFYRYLPYIFIVMLVCGLAPVLVLFQKKDLRERMECSSLSTTARNLQLAFGTLLYSLAIWAGFLVLGALFYRESFFTVNALYAMLNSFAFLLVAAAITLFVSLFAPDTSAIHMISNLLGLAMSFLCGVFIEQHLLSDSVLNIARFLPVYWYIRVNDMLSGLSARQFDLSLYRTALGIQLLFAAAIFAAALAFSRIKRQKSIL